MMLFIRSLLFWVGFTISTVLITPIVLLLSPFPYRWRYFYADQWTQFGLWWIKICCGIDYRVRGQIDPGAKAHIVMAKHQSFVECFVLKNIFPMQSWVVKKELLWIPFFGWMLAALKTIGIDRQSGHRAIIKLIEQGEKILDAGYWVIIFPEGTRTVPGQSRPYQAGGFALATGTGYPIIPVAHNAGEFVIHKYLIRPGTIDFVVGRAMDSQDLTIRGLRTKTQNWIEGEMQKMSTTQCYNKVP